MREISHRFSFLRCLVSAQVFVASWRIDAALFACRRTGVQNAMNTVNSKILANAGAAFNEKFDGEEQ
jgi:hypothetical protein